MAIADQRFADRLKRIETGQKVTGGTADLISGVGEIDEIRLKKLQTGGVYAGFAIFGAFLGYAAFRGWSESVGVSALARPNLENLTTAVLQSPIAMTSASIALFSFMFAAIGICAPRKLPRVATLSWASMAAILGGVLPELL